MKNKKIIFFLITLLITCIKANDASMITVTICEKGNRISAILCCNNKKLEMLKNKFSFSKMSLREFFCLSKTVLLAKEHFKKSLSYEITSQWKIINKDDSKLWRVSALKKADTKDRLS